jgi:peroxiredoxin
MGERGRNELVDLYENTSRESFEIVVYNTVSSLEYLKKAKDEYNVKFIMVSDFLQDHTPFKIIYGAQTRPTVYLINKEGKLVMKSVGFYPEKVKEKLKDVFTLSNKQ